MKFESKEMAKFVAETLNNTQVFMRKKSKLQCYVECKIFAKVKQEIFCSLIFN